MAADVLIRFCEDTVVRDCVFAFEVLRRIGFSADVIYAGTANIVGVGRAAVMILRVPGHEEWMWTIGKLDEGLSDEEFARLYAHAGNVWNALGPEIVMCGFDRSEIRRLATAAVTSIVCKGIPIPRRRKP